MIRITAHSSDPAFLVLRIDRDHNGVVGTFEPARRQDDMGVGVYVMEATNLGALKTWARYQNIHLLNEVRDKAEPTRPLECGNVAESWEENGRTVEIRCAAPYPVSRIPKFCGACGQPANPVTFDDGEPMIGVKCPGCQRVNHGGPAYCIGCGAALPEHHLAVSAFGRVRSEPRALGEVIAELAPGLAP